jgi:hypothetical protein
MCLRLAIERPEDVVARGSHNGYEYQVLKNRFGDHCGYVKLAPGHPWYGFRHSDDNDMTRNAEAGEGVSFSEADLACDQGADDGWWLGFVVYYHNYDDEPEAILDHTSAECQRLCEQVAFAQDIS